MFIVEKVDGGGFWKQDRKYKLFQNAENRVYALYGQGIQARMVEKK